MKIQQNYPYFDETFFDAAAEIKKTPGVLTRESLDLHKSEQISEIRGRIFYFLQIT